MSDTPRTDDLARGNHVVPTEFAEGLERELNEARDYSRATWQSLRDSQDEVLKLTFENREAKRERDEARRKLNNLDVTAIHSCHNECQRPICVLRRERDEAREAATEQFIAGGKASRERDEAREALAKILKNE